MEAPPDIRKRSNREQMADLVVAIRSVRAKKAATYGLEHLGKNEWSEALDEFKEAQELFEELHDVDASSDMLSMEALCLYALDKLDEASEVIRKAMDLKKGRDRPEAVANDLLGLSNILFKKGETAEARAASRKAAKMFRELGLEEEAKKAESRAKKAAKTRTS